MKYFILFISFISVNLLAFTPVSKIDVSSSKILATLKREQPNTLYAYLGAMQYDKCKDVNTQDLKNINSSYLSNLTKKYKDIIVSLEEAAKVTDVNIVVMKMVNDHCSNKTTKIDKKNKEKEIIPTKKEPIQKKENIVKIVKSKNDSLKKVELITGLSPNVENGVYPVIVEDENKCKIFIKVNVDGNKRLGKTEKIICPNKIEKYKALVFSKEKYIDNVDYSNIGSTIYLLEF